MENKNPNKKNERMREIYPYIKDKIVLDIGCYGEIRQKIYEVKKDDSWIHGFLDRYAKHTIGIDIAKEKIDVLREKGYDVYCQNAETFKFNQKFDVIFAGDVIEHLDNPGLFLKRCRKHIKKNGWLIITTNNVFSLDYKIGGLIRFFNSDLEVHPNHTCFFSPTTMRNLLKRNGFKFQKIKFINQSVSLNWAFKHKVHTYLKGFFCNLFSDKLKYTMIIFAKPSKKITDLSEIGVPL